MINFGIIGFGLHAGKRLMPGFALARNCVHWIRPVHNQGPHSALTRSQDLVDQRAAVLRLPSQIKMLPAAFHHAFPQNVEHRDELRKNEHLVALVPQRLKQIEQRLELR